MNRSILVLLVLSACNAKPHANLELERKKILELELSQKTFHLTKNAEAFTNLFSDHFLSINSGNVDSPSKETSLSKFDSYFKSVDFIKWEDVNEPIVRFSDDATVAYVAVQKQVITRPGPPARSASNDTTNFAWLTVYRKINGTWKIDCVTSTNQ